MRRRGWNLLEYKLSSIWFSFSINTWLVSLWRLLQVRIDQHRISSEVVFDHYFQISTFWREVEASWSIIENLIRLRVLAIDFAIFWKLALSDLSTGAFVQKWNWTHFPHFTVCMRTYMLASHFSRRIISQLTWNGQHRLININDYIAYLSRIASIKLSLQDFDSLNIHFK